jgi:hypothetical protein
MSMLAGVIRNSAGELTAFSFALTIFILGYAIWGYIMATNILINKNITVKKNAKKNNGPNTLLTSSSDL